MTASAAAVYVSAPELPPGPRHALVIATARYDDAELSQLRSPAKDAKDLAGVLGDPRLGGFAVTTLIDATDADIRLGIAEFLGGRDTDETVLVYLSCHGIKDRERLYFAATNTVKKYPQASAVQARYLLDEFDRCRSRRQILILDCCFSGGFGGEKGDLDLPSELAGGRGRVVLTGSRETEYSYEGQPANGVLAGSVFTTALVAGLRTGAADADGDGVITVGEAYRYAYRYVKDAQPGQTPQHWLYGGEGEIVLSRNAAGRKVILQEIPADLAGTLQHGNPEMRIGAVNAIAAWLADPDPARNLAARGALASVAEGDIPRVARVARSHLGRGAPGGADPSTAARWIPATETTVMTDGKQSLLGLSFAMTGVAFSPDGALLACGSSDHLVRLWRTETGLLVRAMRGPASVLGGVWKVRFSPDGSLLAAAGGDGRARVWDVAAGTQAQVTPGHKGLLPVVFDVAFSPDGTLLASAGDDHAVRVWDVATGSQVRVLEGHGKYVSGVTFSPDGTLLASAGGDHAIRLWDVATGSQVRLLLRHASYATGVAFSPDGSWLASTSDDGLALLWDVASGGLVHVLAGHEARLSSVAFSPDGRLLATGGWDRTVRFWDVATGKQAGILRTTPKVNGVAFSPAEPLLALSGSDKTVRLWR